MGVKSKTVGDRLDDRLRRVLTEAENDPRTQAALAELRGLIEAAHPGATFAIGRGHEPPSIRLVATIDVDDVDEAYDLIVSRLVNMQVEDELPVSVRPERPSERVLAERRRRREAETGAVREPVAAG